MNRLVLMLSALVMLSSCGGDNGSAESSDDEVYICTGSSSRRYHSDEDCLGLERCRGDIERVSIEDAEDMGRTPCRLCVR